MYLYKVANIVFFSHSHGIKHKYLDSKREKRLQKHFLQPKLFYLTAYFISNPYF